MVATTEGTDGRRTGSPESRWRRHRALLVLFALAGIFALTLGGWLFSLDRQVASVPRFDAGLDRPDRPARVESTARNLLLVGVDQGQGSGLDQALAAPDWPAGALRSDAIMLVHLTADRSRAQVVSIPRDAWVPVPGYGRTKINASFSYGGPALLVRTVEDLTRLYIDHVAVVDLAGFADLTRALGGVEVNAPGAGPTRLSGADALAYVRERHSLPRGDLDRVLRQQNVLRATLAEAGDRGLLANPLRVTRLVDAVTEHLALDDGFDPGEVRSLALSSRRLGVADVDFATIPVEGTDTIAGASVVVIDQPAAREMFAAIAIDQYAAWRADHPVVELPPPGRVR